MTKVTSPDEIITVRRYNNAKGSTIDHIDWKGTFDQALTKWGEMYLAKGKANARINDKILGEYYCNVNVYPKNKEDLITNLNNAALNISIESHARRVTKSDYTFELV